MHLIFLPSFTLHPLFSTSHHSNVMKPIIPPWKLGGQIRAAPLLHPTDRVELSLQGLLCHHMKQENKSFQFKSATCMKHFLVFFPNRRIRKALHSLTEYSSCLAGNCFYTLSKLQSALFFKGGFVIITLRSCARSPCWFWRMKAPNCNMTRGSDFLRWSWAGWIGSRIKVRHTHTDVVCRTQIGSYFRVERFWKVNQSCLPPLLFIANVAMNAITS